MTREEKLEELARLTRDMREAQKTYFRRRAPSALRAALEQERMVDDALAWLGRG